MKVVLGRLYVARLRGMENSPKPSGDHLSMWRADSMYSPGLVLCKCIQMDGVSGERHNARFEEGTGKLHQFDGLTFFKEIKP